MIILAHPQIQTKVREIAKMEATQPEIETAINLLLMQAQDIVQTAQHEKYLEMLSFESLRERLYPTEQVYGDDSLADSVNEDIFDGSPSTMESEIL